MPRLRITYQFDGENVSRLSQYYGSTTGYISKIMQKVLTTILN